MKIRVEKDNVYPDVLEVGTKGSVGVDFLEPEFSDDWDGMLIKAVFQPSRGREVEVAWMGKAVPIPWEVKKYSGDASVVFHGYILEHGLLHERILTGPCRLIIRHTLDDRAANGIYGTPTMYEQLRHGLVEDIETALANAKASGEFRGEPGVPGEPGKKGEPGERGEQGEPGVYILSEGEAMEDVPDGYDVVIDPFNRKTFEIFDRGIIAVYRTSGTGKPGEYDTYTIFYSDNTSTEYQVYNGSDGKNFVILGYYDTLDALISAVASPSAGMAYGVGTEAPYDIYIYDGVSRDWVNNGSVNGIRGEDGKSVEMRIFSGYFQWRQEGGEWIDLIALSELEGKGILKIERTSGDGSPGSVDTYTVTYTDGTTMRYQVTNGTAITVASAVEEGNPNPVSSGAVYTSLDEFAGQVVGMVDMVETVLKHYVDQEIDAAIGGFLNGAS